MVDGLDGIAQAITDWITGLTFEQARHYLLLLIAALIAYRVLAVVLRRILPALLRVAVSLIHYAVEGLAVAGLLVLGLLAMPFRAAGARPLSLLYLSCDAIAAFARWLRSRSPVLNRRTYALGRLPALAVAMVAGYLVWQGHVLACDRQPDAQWCRQPLTAAGTAVDDVWDGGVSLVTGRSS